MQPPKAHAVKARDARLRTRVVRFLQERDGQGHELAEISEGTGLAPEEVRRAVEHNLYVDSLKKGLYRGVIQKLDGEEGTRYKFNRGQYRANRRAWQLARDRKGVTQRLLGKGGKRKRRSGSAPARKGAKDDHGRAERAGPAPVARKLIGGLKRLITRGKGKR